MAHHCDDSTQKCNHSHDEKDHKQKKSKHDCDTDDNKKCKFEYEQKCNCECDRKCECVKCFSCLKTKCGHISARLIKQAEPTFFSSIGQQILYSYKIINTGTDTIRAPIQIFDDKLGGQIIPCSFIAPCKSETFFRTYTIVAADLEQLSITNAAVAYIEVEPKKWVCTDEASSVISHLLT